MIKHLFITAAILCATHAFAEPPLAQRGMASGGFRQHDPARPQPKYVEPGAEVSIPAPADAAVLLDAKTDYSKCWKNAGWTVQGGVMTCVPGTRDQVSAQAFGDCQLHLEFRIPPSAKQQHYPNAGNSGVFFMGIYELQIYASHPEDEGIYADGLSGAIYGENPPLVNAIRRMGGWNAYDVVFHRPHFNAKGECVQKAMMTVFLNGVLVQDHFELMGPTTYMQRTPYRAHPDRLPLQLQDHGSPVAFRNIWVRELE